MDLNALLQARAQAAATLDNLDRLLDGMKIQRVDVQSLQHGWEIAPEGMLVTSVEELDPEDQLVIAGEWYGDESAQDELACLRGGIVRCWLVQAEVERFEEQFSYRFERDDADRPYLDAPREDLRGV